MPILSHSLGYILIVVNPGIVFITLSIILFVSFSRKKSTLDNPLQSNALYALTAILLILSYTILSISFGIKVSESSIYVAL